MGGLLGEEPYSYKNSTTGRWSGFLIAMAGDLAASLGVELAVVELNWAEMITDLHTGKIDLAYWPGPTAQRAMFADFSAPLFHDTYAILARKGFAPKSWAELNVPESLVAVDTGSGREEAVRRFAGNAAITGFKTRDEALARSPIGTRRLLCCACFICLGRSEEEPANRRTRRTRPTPQHRRLPGDAV